MTPLHTRPMHVVGTHCLLLLLADQYSLCGGGHPTTSFNKTKSKPQSLPLLCSLRSRRPLSSGGIPGEHLCSVFGGGNPGCVALFLSCSWEGKPARPYTLGLPGPWLGPAAPTLTPPCLCCHLPPDADPSGALLAAIALYAHKALVKTLLDKEGRSCWQPL